VLGKQVRVGTPAQMSGARSRSYLSDGRVLGWFGEPGVVIDGELSGAEPPAHLARRHGTEAFWRRWTASECQAKLADVPIVIWLRERPLGTGPGRVETYEALVPGVTLSLARA
jgi:hypothetical protein